MGGGYKDGKLQPGKVPTKDEFGGGWDYNYDEVLHGGKGRDVHLQKIAGSKDWGPNWDEDEGGGVWPNAYFFYLPRLCNHCTDAPCIEACPEGALFKDEEFGLVLRNEDACQGQQQCSAACPYKKIYFNEARGVSQHVSAASLASKRVLRRPACASAPAAPSSLASSMTRPAS
jgi:ethylbenzene hydroxylase subunit beta/complex iron-sulfur molybdoenzyme family reductase subunit beta